MACVYNASWVYQRRQNVRPAKIDPDGQGSRVRATRRHAWVKEDDLEETAKLSRTVSWKKTTDLT